MAAASIAEVIQQLDDIISRSIANNDRAGYFAVLYKIVTVDVANKIQHAHFDDNDRMEKMDVIFANFYLDAYKNYSLQKKCPASWQLAFDATKTWKPMIIQHLLAGMNAHISLDLGIATAMVSSGADINDIHNDFIKINAILNNQVNDVKASLFSLWPLSKYIVKLNTGNLENKSAGFSMERARDAAWQVAVSFAPLVSEESKNNYLRVRDNKVASFGHKLFKYSKGLNIVLVLFRIFEIGSVANKIKRLSRKELPG